MPVITPAGTILIEKGDAVFTITQFDETGGYDDGFYRIGYANTLN